tara:strand:- start:851 stop:1846 length:996 start_codon:yes stop_codon:yes gene_type:complete
MIKNFFKNHTIHKKVVPKLDFFILLIPLNFFLMWMIICVGLYIGMFIQGLSPQFVADIDFGILFLFLGITSIMSSYYIELQLLDVKDNSSIYFVKQKYSSKFINNFKVYLNVFGLLFLLSSFWLICILGLILIVINKIILNNRKNQSLLLRLILQLGVAFILSISGFIKSGVLNINYEFFDLVFMYIKFIIPYMLFFISSFIILNTKDYLFSPKCLSYSSGCLSNSINSKIISLISLILISLSILLSIKLNDPLSSISLCVSLPFYLYVLIRGLDKDYQRIFTYPIAIINFFCMTIFPYLFILIFSVFYLTKYYNWHRFNFHFPTFLVEND